MVALPCHQATLVCAARSPCSTWIRFPLGPSQLPVTINFFFLLEFKAPEIGEGHVAGQRGAGFIACCEVCHEGVRRCLEGLEDCGGWIAPNLSKTHLCSAQGAKPGAKCPENCAWASSWRTLVHPTGRQEQADRCSRDKQRCMT